jgi:hypothetical protein
MTIQTTIMKKHSLIIIVIAAAALLFGLSLFISKDIFGPGKELKTKKMNIDERVDSLGKLPFNEDSLLVIEGDINTLASISKINSIKKASLLTNLEYAKQNALVISLKNWLNNSCNSSGLDKVIRTANTCSNKSNELEDLLNTHTRYNSVLKFESRLNAFLAGHYDQAQADGLANGISSAIKGEPFRNCPAISSLESKIYSEISSFLYFVDQEFNQAEASENWYKIDENVVMKYKYYYSIYRLKIEELNKK